MDLLERDLVAHHQVARCRVPFAFYHVGTQMIPAEDQMTVSPTAVDPYHPMESLLTKLGTGHVPVVGIMILTCPFLRPSHVPDDTTLVACEVEGIVEEPIVRLVFRRGRSLEGSFGGHGITMEDHHASHGIRPIHQGCGTFQYLHVVYTLGIDLYSVLIAPLLTLLTDAIMDRDNTVIA